MSSVADKNYLWRHLWKCTLLRNKKCIQLFSHVLGLYKWFKLHGGGEQKWCAWSTNILSLNQTPLITYGVWPGPSISVTQNGTFRRWRHFWTYTITYSGIYRLDSEVISVQTASNVFFSFGISMIYVLHHISHDSAHLKVYST